MIKKILICIAALLLLLSLASCDESDKGISSIELDRSILVMDKGDIIGITAEAQPAITGAALVWHSTNTSVATVSDGIVKAVGSGSAVIICSSANGKYGKCSIVVNSNECNHTPGQWIIDKEATCNQSGIKHTECTLCGDMVEVQAIDRTNDHTPGPFRTLTAATCNSAGVMYRECLNCKALVDTKVSPATGSHRIGAQWITDKEATCGQNGVQHKECLDCHAHLEIEVTPMSSKHVPAEPVIENVTNNTCQEAGSYDSVIYCSICEDEISRTKFATLAGEHTYTEWTNVSATCLDAGIESRECIHCHKLEERPLDALGHDIIEHEGVAPTCQTDGYADYVTCSRCDYTTYQELPKTHHVYDMTFEGFLGKTYPTKTGSGIVTIECKYNCDVADNSTLKFVDLPAFIDPAWKKTPIAEGMTEFVYTATDNFGVEFKVSFLLDDEYNIIPL